MGTRKDELGGELCLQARVDGDQEPDQQAVHLPRVQGSACGDLVRRLKCVLTFRFHTLLFGDSCASGTAVCETRSTLEFEKQSTPTQKMHTSNRHRLPYTHLTVLL